MDAQANDDWLDSDLADDPDLADLVQMFVDEMPGRLAEFEAALAANRRDLLSRLAHQLKGSAGGYGFAPIGSLAAALELSLKENAAREEVAARLDALVRACRRVRFASQ